MNGRLGRAVALFKSRYGRSDATGAHLASLVAFEVAFRCLPRRIAPDHGRLHGTSQWKSENGGVRCLYQLNHFLCLFLLSSLRLLRFACLLLRVPLRRS